MAKYLYGASIQGIQEYIYATNKLQEIIGASEIIDSLGQKFDNKQEGDGAIFGVFDELRANDVKCLKIVFTDGNWYLTIEDAEGNFRLLRVAFIVSLSKSSKNYQGGILEKYKTYFNKIQNAMSLPSEPLRRALLKASPKVAIYFKEGMKPFFPTQKFKKKLDDGSIIFSIDFTQDMEILPFIKKWLPDIEILEPKDLRETFKEQLKAALDILSE